MDKTISVSVALIAIQMLLAAGGQGLGVALLDTWTTPVLVAIIALKLLMKTFKNKKEFIYLF